MLCTAQWRKPGKTAQTKVNLLLNCQQKQLFLIFVLPSSNLWSDKMEHFCASLICEEVGKAKLPQALGTTHRFPQDKRQNCHGKIQLGKCGAVFFFFGGGGVGYFPLLNNCFPQEKNLAEATTEDATWKYKLANENQNWRILVHHFAEHHLTNWVHVPNAIKIERIQMTSCLEPISLLENPLLKFPPGDRGDTVLINYSQDLGNN